MGRTQGVTGAPPPWDMAEWADRASAFASWPDGPAERSAGAAAAAAIALSLAEHGPTDLALLPPTLRETWNMEEPLLALEVKYVSAATPARMAAWLVERGFAGDEDKLGALLAPLWADHVHRWVLPELATWLERRPGLVPGGEVLTDAATRAWPLLDDASAAAVLRATVAVDPDGGRALAREVLGVPAASWPVRRAALELLRDAGGEPPMPGGAAVLIAPGSEAEWARRIRPEPVAAWLAGLGKGAPGGVYLALGDGRGDAPGQSRDGVHGLAVEVAAGREVRVPLGLASGYIGEARVRRGQHGLGLWLPGVRLAAIPTPGQVPLAWAAHACALAGSLLHARAALASSGRVDTASEQLYRAGPTEWSEYTLPQVLWLPASTPLEVTDPLLELAGVTLERRDAGLVFTRG